MSRLVLLSIAIVLISSTLPAQGLRAAAPRWGRMVNVGSRVRVDIADRVTWSPIDQSVTVRRVHGIVGIISPDTLYLSPADSAEAIAISRFLIRQVQVSLGPPSRVKSALEVGAWGAGILALIFQGEAVNRNHRFGSSFRAATIGAGIGFGIGGLIGLAAPYERWRFAWLPE